MSTTYRRSVKRHYSEINVNPSDHASRVMIAHIMHGPMDSKFCQKPAKAFSLLHFPIAGHLLFRQHT
jgi:hypothetical protein